MKPSGSLYCQTGSIIQQVGIIQGQAPYNHSQHKLGKGYKHVKTSFMYSR